MSKINLSDGERQALAALVLQKIGELVGILQTIAPEAAAQLMQPRQPPRIEHKPDPSPNPSATIQPKKVKSDGKRKDRSA